MISLLWFCQRCGLEFRELQQKAVREGKEGLKEVVVEGRKRETESNERPLTTLF
jgi:hypothetical protein